MCAKVSRTEVTDGKKYLEEMFGTGNISQWIFDVFKVNLPINCHKVGASIVTSLLVIFQPLYVRTFPSVTIP